nr:hypothetical protein [Escherichia coli]
MPKETGDIIVVSECPGFLILVVTGSI